MHSLFFSSFSDTTTMVVTQPQDAPDVAVEVSAQKNAPENSDNGRAGLMAAIRNAGGSGKAGLKSVCRFLTLDVSNYK